ncbi:MAG: flagellar hook-length control protein FliK [Pseudomonadota bacterium]
MTQFVSIQAPAIALQATGDPTGGAAASGLTSDSGDNPFSALLNTGTSGTGVDSDTPAADANVAEQSTGEGADNILTSLLTSVSGDGSLAQNLEAVTPVEGDAASAPEQELVEQEPQDAPVDGALQGGLPVETTTLATAFADPLGQVSGAVSQPSSTSGFATQPVGPLGQLSSGAPQTGVPPVAAPGTNPSTPPAGATGEGGGDRGAPPQAQVAGLLTAASGDQANSGQFGFDQRAGQAANLSAGQLANVAALNAGAQRPASLAGTVDPGLTNQQANPSSNGASGVSTGTTAASSDGSPFALNFLSGDQSNGQSGAHSGGQGPANQSLTGAQQLASLLTQAGGGDTTPQPLNQPIAQQTAQPLPTTPAPATAAATGTLQLPAHVIADETLPQLTVHLTRAIQAGQEQLRVQLNPAELGRVDVRLSTAEDGSVNTRIVVERAETLELLQRDVRVLERALQQSGIRLSSEGVDLSLKDNGAQGNGNAFSGDTANNGDNTDHAGSSETLGDEAASTDPVLVNDVDPTIDATVVQSIYARFAPGTLNIEV